MSKLETNTIDNISGSSTLTIGDSNASTISIPKNITLGASGTTITVPSGATMVNNGTQTGFGGITMADMWRITSNINISTYNTNVDITNWERADTNTPGFIGTGLTESSGIFSFPSTGIYQIYLQYSFQSSVTNSYHGVHINTTTDNSNYNNATENYIGLVNNYNSASAQFIFDVTNTSTHKIKFSYFVQGSSSLLGSSNDQRTGFTVIRLGDT